MKNRDYLCKMLNLTLHIKLMTLAKACFINFIYRPRCEQTCLNKGADQPAHLCSLISAFVLHYAASDLGLRCLLMSHKKDARRSTVAQL